MACMQISKKAAVLDGDNQVGERTRDGTVDMHGRPAIRDRTGKWVAGIIILLNQGLATLAFFGIGVNLVLFLTRVMGEGNADAANSVSKWTGTVYIFSLLGAFLSDSYWGRFKTCAIFQIIYVIGLVLLSLTTQLYLLKPKGCGDKETQCGSHSSWVIGLFYLSIYLVALGNGGYQPNIATFGADQFDDENPDERPLKVAFFSYFYLALNLGSLISNTILDYFEDEGNWARGFWASTASAVAALLLFLVGTTRYRHFKPNGNPLSRIAQVVVAASKKWRVEVPSEDEELFEVHESNDNGSRKMLHTEGFRFLDRAAVITPKDVESKEQDPWRLCPISQVEEVKCVMRLLPIWLCTIIYSVVFTQMASLFVEQGDAMETKISSFRIPAASMSSFDICSVAVCIFLYRRLLDPLVGRLKRGKGGDDDAPSKGGITQLERMGVGLFIAVVAMLSAGIVECYRLKYAVKDQCINCEGGGGFSTLSILWQIPQYSLIGASEVFMYVGQLEFFNEHAPDGLKSFGSALCMTSISLGNYVSSLLVSIIMKISTKDRMPGWIPGNLNRGHLDKFYFLLAGLTILDLVAYIACAKWYKCARLGDKYEKGEEKNYQGV